MEAVLKILMVEDCPEDAELVRHEIMKGGIQFIDQLVDTREDYMKAIQDFKPELILSDYSMPNFDGMQALLLKGQLAPLVPFILVTGSLNEETAVAVMKAGADDYILKENLTRLGLAIKAAIEKREGFRLKKEAEAQLRESEDKYRSIYENTSVAILLTAPDGSILSANDFASKLFGLTIAEICESGRNRLIDANDPRLPSILDERKKTGHAKGELTFIKKNGTTFPGEVSSRIFMDKNGNERTSMVIRDLTEQKKAEKETRLLAHSIASINECVSITDKNDIILFINEAFSVTYGYSKEELIGKHISIVRPSEIAQDVVTDILPETIKGAWKGELINRRKDGTLFPVFLSTSVIKDEYELPIALIGIAIDITEIKKSRAELIAAKEKAEENIRLKSAFLSNMSHEIRTPMNAIIGFASLITEAVGDDKNAFAEIVLKSSKQLLTLIDDVILMSRLQSEKIPLNIIEFKPAELVTDVCRIFNRPELRKGLHFTISIPVKHRDLVLRSDASKIKQVVINLTSNALKYTTEGSVELGFDLQNSDVEFYVKDSGIGIPEQELDRVFETFYRGEQVISSAIGGTGLGLNIAKELVDLLGGKIGVTSEKDIGSRFFFTIPYEQPQKTIAEKSITQPVRRNLNDFIILIAEDDPTNYLYLEVLLKNKVKRIDHALNGKEAIELASGNIYNLILMDLKMPVMDGLQATKKLKENYPNIPIIAQTAYSLPEERERAFQAGCDDYISKPIIKKDLMEIINKYSETF